MVPTRLDTSTVASLFALGGDDLRNQLVVDLQQLETALRAHSLKTAEGYGNTDDTLGQVLHNLRGLAATLGAQRLVQLCVALESPAVQSDRASCLLHISDVVDETAHICAQIAQRDGSNP